jgi:hypothetical protein
MPIGIVTSQAEIDLVQDIWPEPTDGMPSVRSGIIEFAPAKSRQIVDEIQNHNAADDAAATRLINRIVDIAGASFIPGDDNPIEIDDETDDIDQEDSADGEDFIRDWTEEEFE